MQHTYRMYGFVNYQLSGIQKAIQYGHAVVEYSLMYGGNEDYKIWSERDKTFVILDGGTTNNSLINKGSLNVIRDEIHNNNIKYQTFYEPDLGDQLTAVVFLADERVWDKELYPDFNEFDIPYFNEEQYNEEVNKKTNTWLNNFSENVEEQNKIVFLRTLLKGKKLA